MSQIQVGDRVYVPYGGRKVRASVIEDRGHLGIKGRRLLGIAIPDDPDEPFCFEMPEVEVELIPESELAEPELTPAEVDDYLIHGGLALILWSNRLGGKLQPRVWLCRDSLGNLTHTFYEERGMLGGQIPPAKAIQWSRIFTPKRDDVVRYLASFGLDPERAEKVATAVGISPRPRRDRVQTVVAEGEAK